MSRRIAVAALLLVGMVASPARATPEDVATEVSQEVMSPFCPGVTLHDCPSAAADALRLRITEWARDGWSKERIIDVLAAEYGDDIRAVPEAEGSGLVAWILPAIAVVAGGGAAWLSLRRWTRPTAPVESTVGTPEERRRLEAELDALRGRL